MHDTQSLWIYFVLVAGIVALPGMDMALVTGTALTRGRRAGLAALAGIVVAGFVHVGAGVAGLGLLLQTLPLLFNLILLAGAAYLAWLAIGLWRSSAASATAAPVSGGFARGALTALLNPKAYVFGVAVLPQFLPAPDAAPGDWLARGLALSAVTALTQISIYGGMALLADRLGRQRRSTATLQRGVALLLGLMAALSLWQGWRALA